jgi:hypothetical protein
MSRKICKKYANFFSKEATRELSASTLPMVAAQYLGMTLLYSLYHGALITFDLKLVAFEIQRPSN